MSFAKSRIGAHRWVIIFRYNVSVYYNRDLNTHELVWPYRYDPLTHPLRDFWHSSSCSRRCGSNWNNVSSPVQHATTLVVSWALVIIFTHDLSMFENLFASYEKIDKWHVKNCFIVGETMLYVVWKVENYSTFLRSYIIYQTIQVFIP